MTPLKKGETLREKQSRFVFAVSQLIQFAYSRGYEFTLGDGYRDPRLHGEIGVKMGYGHPKSCHKLRLAIDLNLFADVDGDGDLDYVTDTAAYKQLGEYWESLHPDARWGGRFEDGNHFSFEHNGNK